MKLFTKIFFVFLCVFLKAQQKEYWIIDGDKNNKIVKKDSLSAVKYLDSLAENTYFFLQLKEVVEEENVTKILIDKGEDYNKANVKLEPKTAQNLKIKQDFFSSNLDSLRRSINEKYRILGFPFNRVKTKFISLQNGIPNVEISVFEGDKRNINSFVIRGYEKVPKRFIKNLEKEFSGKTYTDKTLLAIQQRLQNHPFITLEKPPQTLFTKDSTQIYLFMQKKKSNTFDGIVGFGNDQSNKFSFNGSIDVKLKNMFNSFETFNLFWQRNPNKGQNFDLQTDFPYIFKSNLGINAKMNIYRQDSTFANVKILPSAYYNLSAQQKIGVRGTFEMSSVIHETYLQAKDFNKKGIGIWYELIENSEEPLFLYKMKIIADAAILKTDYTSINTKANQTQYFLLAERNFHLRGRHYLNIKTESSLLNSDGDFSINELYRIGGWNSIRGFNEQQIITDFYTFGGGEYRYLISNTAFFDVFTQLASVRNSVSKTSSKLYSFGLGFNFILPVGLMSFQISNGNEFGSGFKFNETKIHWGIVSKF